MRAFRVFGDIGRVGEVLRRVTADVERAPPAPSLGHDRPAGADMKGDPVMKYLLLKHYRGGPAPVTDLPPMDRWTPEEVDAHIGFMRDFAARLEGTGEYVDGQALAPDGAFVRSWGDKDIDLELHEFVHEARDTVQFSLGTAILDHVVFSLDVTEIAQPLP